MEPAGTPIAPANELDEAIIPVLRPGASRRFLIRPASGGPSRTVAVHGGDLVVMGGRCQKDYQHSVPKQKQGAGPRLSLNFSAPLPGGDIAAATAGMPTGRVSALTAAPQGGIAVPRGARSGDDVTIRQSYRDT